MPSKKYISRYVNKINGNFYKCFEGNKLNWRKMEWHDSPVRGWSGKPFLRRWFLSWDSRIELSSHINSTCRTLRHMKEPMGVGQKDHMGLLSSEPKLESCEMRARGRYGPDRGEIYKSLLKSLDFILSFLYGILSQGQKRPLRLIPSVR